MSYFDQRGQQVNSQVNIVGKIGEIKFEQAEDRADLVDMLLRFKAVLRSAAEGREIEPELAMEAESQVANVIDQFSSPKPEKEKILARLVEARYLLESAKAAARLVTAVRQAVEAVDRLI